MLIFELRQWCKIVPTGNCEIRNFLATPFLYNSNKKFDKAFELTLNVFELWRRLGRVRSKYSVSQTTSDKKFCQKWESQGKLDKTKKLWFLVLRKIWSLFSWTNFFGGKLVTSLHLHSFQIFFCFRNFTRSIVLRRSANRTVTLTQTLL